MANDESDQVNMRQGGAGARLKRRPTDPWAASPASPDLQAQQGGNASPPQHQQDEDEDIGGGGSTSSSGKVISAADEEASTNTYSAFKRVASTGGDPAL